ncbi:MAG TPA: integrase arm-type DNA-binding domain-containing protein [Microvirga sp.]|nr:integrase arm-type DNA-binding domain-containing protein [Microvirga sp.]
MRRLLTDVLLRSTQPPATGRLELIDERTSGLAFRVTSSGAKSWCYRFRDSAGRTSRVTLGAYPAVSLAAARERAVQLRGQIALGVNPVEVKRRERQEASAKTVKAVAERFVREHVQRKKRPATLDQYERLLRLYVLPRWGSRSLKSITRADVVELAEGLIDQGKGITANRTVAMVSSLYSWAADAGFDVQNPAARLRRRAVETRRARVLTDHELRLLWNRITQELTPRSVALALRLQLLLGCRVGEVAGMQLQELEHLSDPERAVWTIPAARMKGKASHTLPLPEAALAVVREAFLLSRPTYEQPAVFVNNGRALVTADVVRAWDAASRHLKRDSEGSTWTVDKPRTHDVRRTVATRLASLGIPAEDVSAILAHGSASITKRHYDQHGRLPEKRRALQRWHDALGPIVERVNVEAG